MQFSVDYTHPETGKRASLGVWQIDEGGHIVLVRAAPGLDQPMHRTVAKLNAMSYVEVEEPPPEDAPRFTLAARRVDRGSSEFLSALRIYIRTYFGLELVEAPATPGADGPPPMTASGAAGAT